MDSQWNWNVKRISGSEFLVNLPSKLALNVLTKMGNIKFITSDIIATVEESNMDPEAFQVLQSVWVRAVGIPKIARSEYAVLELAQLVGDPEEVHLPSLQWKSVWVKVACKNPNQIGGTSEVFINKQGRKISWFFSDKLKQYPPNKPDEDFDQDDDEVTDEEDPESQESHGWLESGKTPPKDFSKSNDAGPSDYQGKRSSKDSPAILDDVVNKDLEISLTKNRDIQHYETMNASSGGMKMSETITDSLNPDIRNAAMVQSVLSNDKTNHGCQKVMGVADIFQEMNDMAVKLNSFQQVVSAQMTVNPHLSDPMKKTSGLAAGNLSHGIPNESSPKLDNLNPVSSTLVTDMGVLEVSKDIDKWQNVDQSMEDMDDPQLCVTVEEKVVDSVITKAKATNIPSKTRQSARIQDANGHILKKAIVRKANAKGITSAPIPSLPNPSCPLDLLARACGFSLGYDDSTRIANISLIQAKEDALLALQNTKQKLSPIPKSSGENAHGDRLIDESSLIMQKNELELGQIGASLGSNLSITDQG
jgi:hypothetical protein